MSICAVVRSLDGLVINTIMAKVTDPPPMDCYLVEIQPDQSYGIGWTWDGSQFVEPEAI